MYITTTVIIQIYDYSNVIGLAHTLVAREERIQYTAQIKLLLRSWLFIVVKNSAIMIVKYYRLTHEEVTCNVVLEVSTA